MTDTAAATVTAYVRSLEEVREPDGRWHPSGLFTCPRSAVYEVRGTPPSDEKDDRNRAILRLGTNLHKFVQDAYTAQSGAKNVYHEVEVEMPGLGVYGHADTLLEYDDGSWELCEWKSIGVFGLKAGLSKGELPKPEHRKQAQTYAAGLATYGGFVDDYKDVVLCAEGDTNDEFCGAHGGHVPPLGDRLKRIRFAYFSRDDLRIEEFVEDVDPSWSLELADYIAGLDGYGREPDGPLPPRLVTKQADHWLCKSYCQFRTRCWTRDGEGEQP